MTKQKKGFWTFIWSLIPGAGEMYMGFKKQGLSIMTVFYLLIAGAAFMSFPFLLFGLPIIWFYSFFNVHNLSALSEEEFYSLEDEYVLRLDNIVGNKEEFINKYRIIIAAVLILTGCSLIWNNAYSFLSNIMPDYMTELVYRIGHLFPQLILGFAIIGFGIFLIRAKKEELEQKTEL